MKTFACKDFGIQGCNFEVSGESDDELVQKAKEHGSKVHNVTVGAQEEQKIRSLIKSV